MRTTRTKTIILAGLLAVWALVFFFMTHRSDEAPRSSGRPGSAAQVARAVVPAGIPRLRTDLLKTPRAPYPAEVQQIFSTPPPPPPPPSALAGMNPAVPAPPPPDPFQEEARQFRYVGFLRSDGTATAFIIRGQEVYTIAVGGMLGNRYRVTDVREDSVTLGSPAGDKQVRLSINGDGATGALRGPEIVTVPPRVPGVVAPPRGPEMVGPRPIPDADQPPRPPERTIPGRSPRSGSQ